MTEYLCICRMCAKEFKSTNELDTDGEGKCEPCKAKGLEIAKQVDAKMAARRASRGTIPERDLRAPVGPNGSGLYFESGRG